MIMRLLMPAGRSDLSNESTVLKLKYSKHVGCGVPITIIFHLNLFWGWRDAGVSWLAEVCVLSYRNC